MKLPHSFRWPLMAPCWYFLWIAPCIIILVCKAKPRTSTECSRECIDCKTKSNFPIYQQYSSHNYVSVLNMVCSVKEFSLSWRDPIFRWLSWQRGAIEPKCTVNMFFFPESQGWPHSRSFATGVATFQHCFQVAGGFLSIYGMKAAPQHRLQRVWEVCSWEASQDFGDLKVL